MKKYLNSSIPANYFRGIEAVGGRLYFGETGMTFRSHNWNIQTGETRIEYRDIQSFSKRNTLRLVPNGLPVFTKDGFEHKFVIFHRKAVMRFLESRIKKW